MSARSALLLSLMRSLDNFIEDRRLAVLQRTSISADVSPSDTAAAALSAASLASLACLKAFLSHTVHEWNMRVALT